ncbi:MAG: VWA domain-containing protein [Planctomycetota bacterium]|nr:MAG: VWA domain-containing protein [Planctomycetota bacterium]
MMEWLAERFAPGPFFGWLCVVALLILPLPWIRHFRSGEASPAVRFSRTRSLHRLPRSLAQRVRFLLPLMRTLAVLALIVAMARPQSGGAYRSRREGIAIEMVLDVSGSMAERDFLLEGRRVRRLDAVKRVFEDFVLGRGPLPGRENDLIGMVSFAMYADTRCPLTLDHGSLVDLLHETEIPGWVAGRQVREDPEAGFTALGDAIVLATDNLRRAGEQAVAGVPGAEAAKSKVMILLTDGRDNPADIPGTTPPDPREAARLAARLGIKIYTIGAVGSLRNRGMGGFFFARRAEVDEPMLKEIAALTGGKYFRATDVDSLVTIYDEIDKLERHVTGEREYQDHVFAARVAMGCALALLFLEMLLAHTRFRSLP